MGLATTPVGRIVFGDPNKLQIQKDTSGQPKKKKDGEVLEQVVIGVAIPKNDPNWSAFDAKLLADDRAAWPQFFDAHGQLLPGVALARKIIDGDGFDSKGQRYDRKEGYAGCWVVKVASGYVPRIVLHDGRTWVDAPAGHVTTGDYVMVEISSSSNQSAQTPGMYRNLTQVAFVGKGVPIVGGTDPDEAFGTAAPPLPPGATHTPQAPTAPPATSAPAPAYTPPPATAPAPAPAAAAPAPGYGGYMTTPAAPPPAAPPPAAPPPAAPPPAGPQMTATATTTYEAYIAAGWTDEQLVSSGFMLPR